jgi:hypothetical protein
MLRYVKAAFLCRVPIPGLGEIPANLLGVIGFGFLGLLEPSLWLLGTGLETAFLFALSTNARFQKVVDAEDLRLGEGDAEEKRRKLINALPNDAQQRLAMLVSKCYRIGEIYRSQAVEEFTADSNRDALERLKWVYLKLLVARNNLLANNAGDSETSLRSKTAALEGELRTTPRDTPLYESRSATLAILKERMANFQRRHEAFQEIESDLTRIEAQVDLMLDNAGIQGKPQSISLDIELATNLAGSLLYGESEPAIADIDQSIQATTRTAKRDLQ